MEEKQLLSFIEKWITFVVVNSKFKVFLFFIEKF